MQALSQLSYGPTKGRELWGTAPPEVKPGGWPPGPEPTVDETETRVAGFGPAPGYSASQL